jgi:hypothetical protein
MVTRTTSTRGGGHHIRALIGAAAVTATVVVGGALWQERPSGGTGIHQTAAVTATSISDGARPMGGMVELYRDRGEQSAAGSGTAAAGANDHMGGLAERWRDQAVTAHVVVATDRCALDTEPHPC